jgi:hypothetical protein
MRQNGVDQLMHERFDARAHFLDAARGESAHDKIAHARVVRRVLHQHGAAERLKDRLVHQRAARTGIGNPAFEIVDEAAVARDRVDVAIARQHIRPERRAPDRVRLAKPPVGRIGIADEGRVERVEGRHGLWGVRGGSGVGGANADH